MHSVYLKPRHRNDWPRWRYRDGRIERNPNLGGYSVFRGRIVRRVAIIPGITTPLGGTAITAGSQNFTIPGTYSFTLPSYNILNVTVDGGGGGGAEGGFIGPPKSPFYNPGPGGFPGGQCVSRYLSNAVNGVVTIVVGAGGPPGTNGNTSSFNGTMVATGGGAGTFGNPVDGTGSGGNISNTTGGGAGGGGGDPDGSGAAPGANGSVSLSWT